MFSVLLGLYARREPYRRFVRKADEYGCNRHYKSSTFPPLNSLVSKCDQWIGRGTLQNPWDLSFFELIGDPIHTYSDEEFVWLFSISTLERFRADGIYLTDNLAAKLVEAHPNLHTIRSQNTKLTAKGAAAIAKAKNIKELDLSGNDALSDDVIREFESMPNLEYLSLHSPSISIDAINRLRKALPNCKVRGP
jgi:Leucine-rich repeat (LRR) protein